MLIVLFKALYFLKNTLVHLNGELPNATFGPPKCVSNLLFQIFHVSNEGFTF
jgi:hypothetical protein